MKASCLYPVAFPSSKHRHCDGRLTQPVQTRNRRLGCDSAATLSRAAQEKCAKKLVRDHVFAPSSDEDSIQAVNGGIPS